MTVRPKDGSARQADPTYRTYHGMKSRCLNENHSRYESYGGRGITICDRWLHGENDKSGLECFIEDMGLRPSEEHTIGRKNNDLGYCLDNCRWETDLEQRRNTSATRWVDIYGETISLAEAVERFGKAPYTTVRMRIQRGWDDVRAIITPINITNRMRGKQ